MKRRCVLPKCRKQIIVDCSHANANKQPERQGMVTSELMDQIEKGNRSIRGFMLESNLEWGNQPMTGSPKDLKPGVSVTDACIDWETTEEILREIHTRYKRVIEERFYFVCGAGEELVRGVLKCANRAEGELGSTDVEQ